MIISVLVLIVIVIQYRKIEKVNLFFFTGYIIFSLLDLFCYLYLKLTHEPTEKFYAVCIVIVFFLYLLYYFQLLYGPSLKKIQSVLLLLFIINIWVMSYAEDNVLQKFSFNILYINILLLTFSIILFLYQTFNSDKIFEIKNYLPFWISVGFLIFFIGSIPIFFFRKTVSTNIYFFILFLLNVIYNGVVVFGLFWNKPDKVKQI